MYIHKLQYVILLLISTTVFAAPPEKCPDVNQLAQMLLKMEFHGRRSYAHNSCLKKVKSKAVVVRPEQRDEGLSKPREIKGWIKDFKLVKIEKIKKIDFPERYLVIFSYYLNKKKQFDQMEIQTFDGTIKKIAGCAAIVTPPKNLILTKECINP